ncbi:LysR family transcriptional regulator [Xanthobacter sp. V4C-4]|uniref:LysR family transcriptional regulator n=1 Tax=Xanthobacter cornucopiae TaxID=3119924 RepID=UPI00372C0C16
MTLDQLRVFAMVAEHLHMTRAAERLHMTQSAVSASVAALEASCAVALFHRVGRRIELTDAGTSLLPEARAILARVEAAQTVLADLSGLKRGHLVLKASQTIANYWMGPLLHRFRQLYPEITLSLSVGNTAQVAAAVLAGEVDMGFAEGEVSEPLLARSPIPGDRMVLVVPAAHPWVGRADIAPADLLELPVVLREAGSGTRQMFESALRGAGVAPERLRVALELPSNEAVLSAVIAGAGATVISDLVARAGLAAGTLAVLPLALPPRRFHALRHADRYHSRAAAALLALAREPVASAMPGGGDSPPRTA